MLPALSNARLFLSNLPIRRKGMVVIAIPAIALIVSTGLFAYAQWNANAAEERVRHTLDVQRQMYRIAGAVLQAQSLVRDLGTDDDHGLAQFRKAKQQLRDQLDQTQTLIRDNPGQTARVKILRSLIDEMLTRLDAALTVASAPGENRLSFQQWVKWNRLPNEGVRQQLSSMIREQERLLTVRAARQRFAKWLSNIAIALSFAFGILGALIATRLFTSAITRRIQVLEANANRLHQGLPLAPVPPGSDEIGRLGAALERTSALLTDKSERLKLALKTARIVVWEMDPSLGRIRYEGEEGFVEGAANPGGLLPATIDALFELVHAQERAGVKEEFANALATGTEFRRECQIAGPDHSTRWILLTARQYSHGPGSSTVLGVVVDITERKRSEQIASRQAEELAKSEQSLREQTRILQCVLDSMGDGVVVADSNGAFLLFNPAAERILGRGALKCTADEWPQQYGVFAADQITPYASAQLPLARALQGAEVDNAELFIRNEAVPEGRWISATARPVRDESGASWGGVVVFGDVTERKRADESIRAAKEAAENANRAKSEFLSRMSHELRTPLNSILGFSQILEMHDLEDRPRECVEQILKAGNHLLGLIDEVLDIARIEAGRLPLSPEPVLVSDSVHQALALVQPLADARSIALTFDRPEGCRQHVQADRQRLHQVLLNLLSNAVKYNHDGGRVDVFCAKSRSGRLRLSVRDTGAGISKHDQTRLFAPFERLAATQSAVEGTGLGLALSKRLMEAMGGQIGVMSLPGEGSTFWIELPLAEAPEDAMNRQEPLCGIEVKHMQDQRTVLYVEDNLSNIRLMEHIASYRPQIKLMPAMQGRLGLELAREHMPNLILLDLHLPDLFGDQVLKELQADPKTSRIPVVMISADATPGQVQRLLTAGASAYITKPLNVEKILSLFDNYLSDRSDDQTPSTAPEIIEIKS